MPNSAHSSATTDLRNSAADSTANRTADNSTKRHRQQSPVHDTQRAIKDATEELRRVDRQLAKIAEHLPQANGEFDMLAELRGAVDVVRVDLLGDAIATLATASLVDQSSLRRRFTARQGWLAPTEE
jgi:septal ring factor EnvC (AmiA/AmiB activator)